MKTFFKISLLLFCSIFLSCSSSSNYSKNTLAQNFFKGKTITFLLDHKSVSDVNVRGPRIGTSEQPDVKIVFQQSIEELASETKLNLKFIESASKVAANETTVEVTITDILWKFGFSSAEMRTSLDYKVILNNKIYKINGTHTSGGGSKENNLRKSLKNATYNFLKELEK